MNSLLHTIQFLTVLPVGGAAKSEDFLKTIRAEHFPVVGLLIGFMGAAAGAVFFFCLPPLVAAASTILTLVFLTGGLHLDGVADTADGFFSARPREDILRIMRDSRTGAMGVVAVVGILILKVASLASIREDLRLRALLLMPLLGRCAMGILLNALPSARSDGMAASMQSTKSKVSLYASIAVPLLTGWLLLGTKGVVMVLLSLLASAPVGFLAWRKIGGLTGDVLGAACEVVEAAALVTAAGIGFGIG